MSVPLTDSRNVTFPSKRSAIPMQLRGPASIISNDYASTVPAHCIHELAQRTMCIQPFKFKFFQKKIIIKCTVYCLKYTNKARSHGHWGSNCGHCHPKLSMEWVTKGQRWWHVLENRIPYIALCKWDLIEFIMDGMMDSLLQGAIITMTLRFLLIFCRWLWLSFV